MEFNTLSQAKRADETGAVVCDRAAIEWLLQHRDHALFLHTATVQGWHVNAQACWDAAHPHLQGHFPGLPIVPGVFLVEAAAQAVGVVLGTVSKEEGGDEVPEQMPVLAGLKACRLHQSVRPGEMVWFDVDVRPVMEGKYYEATAIARDAGGIKILNVELNVAMVSRSLAVA
ncbi:Beta-hydroxyacyl-(acyl-carrier-protein) dehydratase FabA/FabZ [Burkholderia sp. lig30]|uniref:3-hydroxyacyl-ACP dehydratase FabZ family protein n=1 Tax=Burkholderia sp. lig30 TaxID=1192124 RepID=UPI000461AEBD|nr:FabA/FabZ family ACP-dehydratase [Burkholderia sp. lig30]KDB06355.1 Beta-hydroxyacyl-(acyl-carrier-protein) dehydratase FabA/FabZ [Burkholderia sp. lig30]